MPYPSYSCLNANSIGLSVNASQSSVIVHKDMVAVHVPISGLRPDVQICGNVRPSVLLHVSIPSVDGMGWRLIGSFEAACATEEVPLPADLRASSQRLLFRVEVDSFSEFRTGPLVIELSSSTHSNHVPTSSFVFPETNVSFPQVTSFPPSSTPTVFPSLFHVGISPPFGNLESTSVTVSTLFPNFISGVSSCSISYKTSNISHFDVRLVLGEFVDFEQLPGNNSAKVHVSAAVFLSPTSVLCFVPRSEFGSR